MKAETKTATARMLGIARSTLYYVSKQEQKDWQLKVQIEEVMREHPGYGSPRIALALKRNKKPIDRVMHKFGIKARRRRRAKKYRKTPVSPIYANLLITTIPEYSHHIWAADFTAVCKVDCFV